MRTNIDIDDKLMKQAMKATGAATKKEAVETALRAIVQLKKQKAIGKWFGKVQWEGNLDAMREGRFLDWGSEHEQAPRKATRSSKTAA